MGMHVQWSFLPRLQPSQLHAFKSPLSKKHSQLRHLAIQVDMKLPDDVRKLKQKIIESHPSKLMHFSLTQMRYVATPPVLIPDVFNNHHAVVVSGKTVPLTMRMWRNCKRNIQHLEIINERVTYR
ncbi:hypothetical protein CCR75_008993 [Bremia lactucae]|uniref:Uncharacterized protein n=1 Tax=Bremia lactucae TaxID=4779 RepID=A0A976FRL9_BRELC|nr:hypothetical protein CCR75_008993 [Bremia lactucae]